MLNGCSLQGTWKEDSLQIPRCLLKLHRSIQGDWVFFWICLTTLLLHGLKYKSFWLYYILNWPRLHRCTLVRFFTSQLRDNIAVVMSSYGKLFSCFISLWIAAIFLLSFLIRAPFLSRCFFFAHDVYDLVIEVVRCPTVSTLHFHSFLSMECIDERDFYQRFLPYVVADFSHMLPVQCIGIIVLMNLLIL